jgi:type 2A phosphatase activator TIP41
MTMALTQEGTTATNEPYPSPEADHTITHSGWKITTRKLPILKAGPIEEMTEKLGIAPPEMIFGDNLMRIEHLSSGWNIEFNAFDALDLVDKKGDSMLKVAYSKEWQESRQDKYEDADIKGVVKPFDWSYSTPYSGTVGSSGALSSSTTPIPLELLKRPDPILFFDDVMLYEDELADNGIAMLSAKIRVMPARLLLLCRFFLRLDDVIFRIRDTRVFVEFRTGEVIREYTAREEKFETIRQKFSGRRAEDASSAMRDASKLAEYLPVVEQRLEEFVVK